MFISTPSSPFRFKFPLFIYSFFLFFFKKIKEGKIKNEIFISPGVLQAISSQVE